VNTRQMYVCFTGSQKLKMSQVACGSREGEEAAWKHVYVLKPMFESVVRQVGGVGVGVCLVQIESVPSKPSSVP